MAMGESQFIRTFTTIKKKINIPILLIPIIVPCTIKLLSNFMLHKKTGFNRYCLGNSTHPLKGFPFYPKCSRLLDGWDTLALTLLNMNYQAYNLEKNLIVIMDYPTYSQERF
jgi:hypothetical protein